MSRWRRKLTPRPAVWTPLALLVPMVVFASGCGGGAPFKITPVRGKVTYSDGTLIQADQIVVTFVPQDVQAAGKDAPASAQGDVNVADGTIAGLTTRAHHDGAIVGRHKVTVQALKKGPGGVGMPTGAVPLRYTRVDTTPLSVEVTSGGANDFPLTIDKGP